jgi:hypothetical protein
MDMIFMDFEVSWTGGADHLIRVLPDKIQEIYSPLRSYLEDD